MIKAGGRATVDGADRALLVVGLSRRNTEKLLQNQPIRFDARPLGVDCKVVVLGGETEADLQQDLRVLGPVTGLGERRPAVDVVAEAIRWYGENPQADVSAADVIVAALEDAGLLS